MLFHARKKKQTFFALLSTCTIFELPNVPWLTYYGKLFAWNFGMADIIYEKNHVLLYIENLFC